MHVNSLLSIINSGNISSVYICCYKYSFPATAALRESPAAAELARGFPELCRLTHAASVTVSRLILPTSKTSILGFNSTKH